MRRANLRFAERGFTLPELLVVIVLFAVLGGASLLLLRNHPMDVERRNAERQTAVAYIVQAVTNYHKKFGVLPEEITDKEQYIENTEDGADICSDVVPNFANDLPYDPTTGGFTEVGICTVANQKYLTGFTIMRSRDSTSITVNAPAAEAGKHISITKRLQ